MIRRADVEHALTIFMVAAFLFWVLTLIVYGKDDGRYANSPLKPWFDSLESGYGLCCSVADGRKVEDPDIDMTGSKCSEAICVRVDGEWYDVPDKAILKVPNRYGPAVVWPMTGPAGGTYIRCFLPGAGT